MKEIYHQKFGKMLRQFGLTALVLAGTSISVMAQEDARTSLGVVPASAEAFPGYAGPSGEEVNSPDALWSIQFDYNATSRTSGDVGMAAAQFINNEFWVSRWQSDTLYRFDNTGTLVSEFTIAGLSGTRSLASDGTYLYAGTNTTTIYRIDPVTRLLAPPHISSGSANPVRHCSYDPSLNNGAGGFWVGNFGTDIDAISMNGALLTSIPSSSHGLAGMYGSAYDGVTAGGPYLWIFNQGGANTTTIERITIATGTTTPLAARDVFTDFAGTNSLTSGLAGGLFISSAIVPGLNTIGGIIQGTPNNVLFGYELNDLVLPANDLSTSTLRSSKGYTMIPASQTFGETFSATVTNNGSNTLNADLNFTVMFNGSTVYTNTQSATNLASGQSTTLTSGAFSPANGIGTYEVWAISSPQGSTDPNPANDSAYFSFMVTDSTFARDDNQPDGGTGYAVSTTSWAYAVSKFELFRPDTLSSIWIELATPTSGDTTYAVVASVGAGGAPTAVVYTGPVVLIGAGNTYVLPVPGGLSLAAGTYSFGCYEGINTTINLAQSPNYFTAAMNHFFTPTNGWTQSGIQTARFIRPNFGTAVGVGIEDPRGMGVIISPNPTSSDLHIFFEDQLNADAHISILNPVGQVVRNYSINPSVQNNLTVEMAEAANGVYFVRIEMDGKVSTRKVVVAH